MLKLRKSSCVYSSPLWKAFQKKQHQTIKTHLQHQCAQCLELQQGIMHELKALHLDNGRWYIHLKQKYFPFWRPEINLHTGNLKRSKYNTKWVWHLVFNDISLKKNQNKPQQNNLNCKEKSTFSSYFSPFGKSKPLMEPKKFVYVESPERQTTRAGQHPLQI